MARGRSFEESALDLARDVRAQGHGDLAAALLEVVPETGSVTDEAYRALIGERLARVAAAEDVAPRLRETAAQLVDVARDHALRRGRTGTVWIAWDDGAGDEVSATAAEDAAQPGYSVSWQADRGDGDWCEDGPGFTDLREALAWARARTDTVVVRPSWDEGTYYWAGQGNDWRNLPPLDEPRA